ncbi:glycerol-3-phosphate 1-O-acyltransferase PlsY [Desulfovibrio inopinatus]|uniref:glycerol-3-phosphate 1-O-acyltransferase PlsY n=1 Tax=Desulfovibrio inopinatus TaxID=102109 RepID=UPI00041D3D25|nr:glycerol-3-phosphate 1-O-acyltransferase PlsY [Desulfovibrio inopinatus]
MSYFLWWVLTFLAGSVPFGLFIARIYYNVDPRGSGSGNVGATNVARLCGFKAGVATLVFDFAKGFMPIWVGMAISDNTFFLSMTALAAILGHMYSPFLYGKGGKGVATTLGVFAALAFTATFLSSLVCILAIVLSGYVSMGSLLLVTVLPIFLLFTGKYALIPVSLAVLVLVFWKHRENIDRLAMGHEKPWRKKKS